MRWLPGKTHEVYDQRRQNQAQTILIFAAMIALLGYLGTSTFGSGSALLVVVGAGVIGLLARKARAGSLFASPSVRRVLRRDETELFDMVENLSGKANFDSMPEIAYVASPVPNAMSLGATESHKSAIVVTEGLLRKLSPRELSGVLAHEIAHIQNKDLSILRFGDTLRRMTGFLSQIGLFLLLFNLPLALFSSGNYSPQRSP